jgi:Zn-finger nucleic acid-binding protein
MSRRTRLLLGALTFAVALLAAVSARQWVAIDACLDCGGCWNDAADRCEQIQERCSRR